MTNGTELRLGQMVRITGGVSDKGKIGQVSDLEDAGFVGVRIPDSKAATTYVTRGSVEVLACGETGSKE